MYTLYLKNLNLTILTNRYPPSPIESLFSLAKRLTKFKLDWILGGFAFMHTKTNVGKKSSADIGRRPWFDILSMWKMALEHFVTQFILSCVATLPSIFSSARKWRKCKAVLNKTCNSLYVSMIKPISRI